MSRRELLRSRAHILFRLAYAELSDDSTEPMWVEAMKYASLVLRGPAWFLRFYQAGRMEIAASEVEDAMCVAADDLPGSPLLLPEEADTIAHHNEQVCLLAVRCNMRRTDEGEVCTRNWS